MIRLPGGHSFGCITSSGCAGQVGGGMGRISANGSLETDQDNVLIAAARRGEQEAFDVLYRLHADAGIRFARRLLGNHTDAEDIVQEAFTKVMAAIDRGNGPHGPFRPYLFRAIRSTAADHWGVQGREVPVDESPVVPFEDEGFKGIMERADNELALQAFTSLPLRWQTVLWHADVEGEPPRRIAPLMGIEPNAVSALARRARAGLREAYVALYGNSRLPADCQESFTVLAATVLQAASSQARDAANDHAKNCEDCTEVLAELGDLRRTMRAVLAPLLLGGPAAMGGIGLPHGPARESGNGPILVRGLVAALTATLVVAAAVALTGVPATSEPMGTSVRAEVDSQVPIAEESVYVPDNVVAAPRAFAESPLNPEPGNPSPAIATSHRMQLPSVLLPTTESKVSDPATAATPTASIAPRPTPTPTPTPTNSTPTPAPTTPTVAPTSGPTSTPTPSGTYTSSPRCVSATMPAWDPISFCWP